MSAVLFLVRICKKNFSLPQGQKGNASLKPLVGFYPRKLGIFLLIKFLSLLRPPRSWVQDKKEKNEGAGRWERSDIFARLWAPWVSELWTIHLCTPEHETRCRIAVPNYVESTLLLLLFTPREQWTLYPMAPAKTTGRRRGHEHVWM